MTDQKSTTHQSTTHLVHGVLGGETQYPKHYDATLLFPIARQQGRESLGIAAGALPFSGVDYWNAYEISWLMPSGKPQVAILLLSVPCDSPSIVESKSLKLYFNSLNQQRFDNTDQLITTVTADISQCVGAQVTITLTDNVNRPQVSEQLPVIGELLDDLDIDIPEFSVTPEILASDHSSDSVSETLCSHLLRSNCPVTDQPDWASIMIRYEGPAINREQLLRYLIGFRHHNEFHEQCVERVFMDVLTQCHCEKLTVYARYTRRGGIDINPFRSNFETPYTNIKTARQ